MYLCGWTSSGTRQENPTTQMLIVTDDTERRIEEEDESGRPNLQIKL